MYSSSTERAQKIALKREFALQQYEQLKTQIRPRAAARAVGVSQVTLWRWRKAFAEGGLDALQPKFFKCGVRSAVEGVRFSPKAVKELEKLIVTIGNRQRAWLRFSQGPHCPAAMINFRDIPAPVMRLVQLRPLQARCYISAATGTVYFRLGKGGAR